jgi:UDP-N-acetylmuramyl pentapeptide phosphotransferase/UDP-N-acetylglucosamine-1-phosphate transferase
MSDKRPPIIIDMTPEGEFRDPPPPPAPRGFEGLVTRLGGMAMLVAISAGGLLMAAVALVAIGVLLPIVLAAGAIGAITIWWRLRKARARGESTIIITQFDRRER